MPTLLELIDVHPSVTSRLDAGYTRLRARLPAIDTLWLDQYGPLVDGIITGGQVGVPASLMQALPNLRVIGINGVGTDKVDLELAVRLGIRVSNTPDVLTADVADLAVGLTLALLRRLPHGHSLVRDGKWKYGQMPLTTRLTGKRVGIVGLGRIGRAVAKRFNGFTDVIGYADPMMQDVPFTFYPDLVTLAQSSDVLVVCASGAPGTHKIVDAPVLAALGPTGVLVNVSRGSIVDEAALVAALLAGTIAGAALDVFENEPHVPPEFCTMDNVILSPHAASGTHETRQAMGTLVMDNIDAYFGGTPMPSALF